MKKLYFLPYKMCSGSINNLQKVLGGLKIKPTGNYHPINNHLVVNWGTGSPPYWANNVGNTTVLNRWDSVIKAVNKLRAFQLLDQAHVPVPDFTIIKDQAQAWAAAGNVVICRQVLNGMEGRGIVVARTPAEVVDAPLYTKLFPKDKEYRVHVFKGQVIDYVQKKLRNGYKDIPNRNKYIRNTANGWIFARTNVALPEEAGTVAITAVGALGLDFGAVDLATNITGQVVVFEVNTAPGLEGTTVHKYAEAIETQLQ